MEMHEPLEACEHWSVPVVDILSVQWVQRDCVEEGWKANDNFENNNCLPFSYRL